MPYLHNFRYLAVYARQGVRVVFAAQISTRKYAPLTTLQKGERGRTLRGLSGFGFSLSLEIFRLEELLHGIRSVVTKTSEPIGAIFH